MKELKGLGVALLFTAACGENYPKDSYGCPKEVSLVSPIKENIEGLRVDLKAIGGGSPGSTNEGCMIVLDYVNDTRTDMGTNILEHGSPDAATAILDGIKGQTSTPKEMLLGLANAVVADKTVSHGTLSTPKTRISYSKTQYSGDPYQYVTKRGDTYEKPDLVSTHERVARRTFGAGGSLQVDAILKCKVPSAPQHEVFTFEQRDTDGDLKPDSREWIYTESTPNHRLPTSAIEGQYSRNGEFLRMRGRLFHQYPLQGNFDDVSKPFIVEDMQATAAWLEEVASVTPEQAEAACQALWNR